MIPSPYVFITVLDYALVKAIQARKEELGFCLKKQQSRCIGPVVLTDLDFADDIALLSERDLASPRTPEKSQN